MKIKRRRYQGSWLQQQERVKGEEGVERTGAIAAPHTCAYEFSSPDFGGHRKRKRQDHIVCIGIP